MGLFVDRKGVERKKLYSLSKPLIRLSRAGDFVYRRDLVRGGVLFLGSPGSGKTSDMKVWQAICWSDQHAALILSCKPETVEEALAVAEQVGRLDDVMIVRPGGYVLKFLADAIKHHGNTKGVVEQVVERLMEAEEIATRKYGGMATDDFFIPAKKGLIRECTFVDMMAHDGEVSLLRILLYIQTLPTSLAALEDPNRCEILKALELAEQKCPESRRGELALARDYFTKEIPNLSDKTRSSIQITATVGLGPLLRFPLVDLFDGTGEEIDPAECIRQRKIVIVDVPVKVYGETIAKVAGVIYKKVWADTLHRRWQTWDGDPDDMPLCGIWVDESQTMVTLSDLSYVDTCRSTRGYLAYATQNLPGFINELGGNEKARHITDTLLANLTIHVAHNNKCPQTNKYMSDVIGKEIVRRRAWGHNAGDDGRGGINHAYNEGWTEVWEYQSPSDVFQKLQCGGMASDPPLTVEGIIYVAGRTFKHNGKRYLKMRFRQDGFRPNVAVFAEKIPEARNWSPHVPCTELGKAIFRRSDDQHALFTRWCEFWINPQSAAKGGA
jgi:hypothetical protein